MNTFGETVKKIISPGIWIDTKGQMHFNPQEFCLARGIPPTQENQDAAAEAIKDAFREMAPEIPLVDVFDLKPLT